MVARIDLQEKRTLLGNKLDEEITLRGNNLWEEMLFWDFNDNFVGGFR